MTIDPALMMAVAGAIGSLGTAIVSFFFSGTSCCSASNPASPLL
jgi:hypothetical protein